MVRAELLNTRTAGMDTNHSTMVALLLVTRTLLYLWEQKWMQFE